MANLPELTNFNPENEIDARLLEACRKKAPELVPEWDTLSAREREYTVLLLTYDVKFAVATAEATIEDQKEVMAPMGVSRKHKIYSSNGELQRFISVFIHEHRKKLQREEYDRQRALRHSLT